MGGWVGWEAISCNAKAAIRGEERRGALPTKTHGGETEENGEVTTEDVEVADDHDGEGRREFTVRDDEE